MLTACTSDAAPKNSSPTATTTSGGTQDPTTDPTPDGPQIFEAGTATPDEAKTVTGTGPATINFSIEPMAPVFEFTCADCTDEVNVTLTDPFAVMWHTTGPVDGAWLPAPIGAIGTNNSITVDVNGTWTMTVTNMFTLPTTSGPQSGRGAAVFKFDQAATQIDYTFAPYGDTDIAGLYAYNKTGNETARETFHGTTSGTLNVTLPAYIFIRADGDWTITPR